MKNVTIKNALFLNAVYQKRYENPSSSALAQVRSSIE